MELSPRTQQMYAVVKEYLETDMTQSDFCRSKELPESTFHYWLKRYRTEHDHTNLLSSDKKVKHNFIPLEITSPANFSPIHCEIERPNGTIIKLKCQKVSPGFLELLRSLSA